MHFLDYEGELLNLQLLALYFAIFVLDLAVCDIEIGLQFFKLCHTNNVFANLHNLELKLFVLNRSCAQLVAKLFNLELIFLDLLLL